MRRFWVALLALSAACGSGGDATGGTGFAIAIGPGPDPIVLRVAQAGGTVRAYRYPRLDSVVWKSVAPAPALASILAFDQENGSLAYLDRKGIPGWIDLRIGTVVPATRTPLDDITSLDAWAIYGVKKDSTIQRMTPSGDWSLNIGGKVSALFPLPDGSLVVQDDQSGTTHLTRLRPPESAVMATATIPTPERSAVSPLGDRLAFGTHRELILVGAQSLRRTTRTRLSREIVDMVASPSGDRLYVATKGSRALDVVDRFTGQRGTPVRLPGPARDLRMDPLGRLVLARADSGDQVWVVATGPNRLVNSVASQWRPDLPFVAADGSVATVQGNDVAFVVAGEARPRMIVREGAREVWHFVFWNGFRPRAKGLDQPVVFQEESTPFVPFAAAVRDSVPPLRAARVDTPTFKPPAAVAVDTPTRAAAPRTGWTVSFAAVLSEERARELARGIRVDGREARVVVTVTEGVRIHRVIMGPYPTREDAERVGRASGQSFWVFEGPP